MMKLKTIFSALIAISIGLLSCKKEAPLQETEIKPEYVLPQGNHPYDQQIVSFYKKYNANILYKFSSKDFRWNLTENIPYIADQADEAYVGQALDTLNRKLFRFYSEPFLKEMLPYKIILAKLILAKNPGADTSSTPLHTAFSTSHFAFGDVNSGLNSQSAEENIEIKGQLHNAFWASALYTHKIAMPPQFAGLTDYSAVWEDNINDAGIFVYEPQIKAEGDFLTYIKMITSHTSAYFEENVFNPENDPNGRFKLKYTTIVNYYKSKYNLDLQLIGNTN
jgi:hypothetical protein